MKLPKFVLSPVLALIVLLGSRARAVIPTGPTPITFAWNYPSNVQVDVFKIYSSTHVNLPTTNWTLISTVSGTNTSAPFLLQPGIWFFYCTASNFWGETGPSNITNTPAVPVDVPGTSLSRP